MPLPAPVVPMSEVALIDEIAVGMGIGLDLLMERAGQAVADEIQRSVPSGPVMFACGSGNNGGDGYVAARILAQAGRRVLLWPVLAPKKELCLKHAAALPASVTRLSGPPRANDQVAVLVDAVLGAGVAGDLRYEVASALALLGKACSSLKIPIIAIDVPSGLGTPHLLRAQRTICLQVAKSELLVDARMGEFKTVDIGIPSAAITDVHPVCLRRFPRLHKNGHKGDHGEVLIIGGGSFPGALELACRGAQRSGCDLVRAWTAEGPPLPASLIAHRQQGMTLAAADPSELTPYLARAGAVLIGPGLGREPGCAEAARQAFSLAVELGVPVVVDADGIDALKDALHRHADDAVQVLLTPHRGEARNLLGTTPDDSLIHQFARPNRVVLAKAPVDLVSDGRRWQRNPRGNPRMAMGGTGDILAGIAAGLMARGATAFDAARIAVFWLTTAGDELWQESGPCYTPEELCEQLPGVLRVHLSKLNMWPPIEG